MPSELAYKIADDIVAALFTNGAKQKASRLVLELDGGRNGGGWGYRPARDHIADVIEKHLASKQSAQHSVQRIGGTDDENDRIENELSELGHPSRRPANR